jgi:hypothetical protein
MDNILSYKRIAFIYSIPLIIFSISFYMVLGGFLSENPKLVIALTLDLMITAPLLYFFAIRKTKIPNFTAVSVFVAGTVIVSLVLPTDTFPVLEYIGSVFLPLLEVGIASTLIFVAYKKRKEILAEENKDDYFLLFKKSAEKSFGETRLAYFFASEIAFVYYSFFLWKKHSVKANEFTYHKKSGSGEILGTIGAMFIIEAAAMHLFIEQWSVIAAWILTFGSLYAVMQIIAHIKACSRRLIAIKENHIAFKYGLFGDVNIEYSNIKNIEATRQTPKEKDGVMALLLAQGLETHSMMISLHKSVNIVGAYGLKKTGHTMLFNVDDKEGFIKTVEERLL